MKKNELRNRIVKTLQKDDLNLKLDTLLAIKNIANDYLILDKKYKNIPKVCTCGKKHDDSELQNNKCSKCRGWINVEMAVMTLKTLKADEGEVGDVFKRKAVAYADNKKPNTPGNMEDEFQWHHDCEGYSTGAKEAIEYIKRHFEIKLKS